MSNRRFSAFALSLALLMPSAVFAQNPLNQFLNEALHQLEPDSEKRWLRPPDERRAYVKITNDWRDTVRLTMWTKRGTQIGSAWTIRSGQAGYLKEDRQRITATEDYSIRVGDDSTAIPVGRVGERRDDVWYVTVRDIWRATHRHGRGGRGREGGDGIEQGF
jgi:hypothetical protein